MGHKLICFKCRKSFSIGTDYSVEHSNVCPNCGNAIILVDQKFKPPKKSDEIQWEVVRYLVEHGFKYQHVEMEGGQFISYPDAIKEAVEFVRKYSKHPK